MDLLVITARVAGKTLDVIRDLGVFDSNIEPQLKEVLSRLIDGGMTPNEATAAVVKEVREASVKAWPDIEDASYSYDSKNLQEAVWNVEDAIHEILHVGVDSDFGLGKTNRAQDLLNEVFIGTVGAKPPNIGLDSMQGDLPGSATVADWFSAVTSDDVPEEIRPTVDRMLKHLKRGLADEMKTRPWAKAYGEDYERVRGKIADLLKGWEDPGLEALTAETEKRVKVFFSLLVKRLKKLK